MRVITGSSNKLLAQRVAERLKLECIDVFISDFPNGERKVRADGLVQGEDVIFIQTLSQPINTLIIETLLFLNALEINGVGKIYLVIPWMGYSIQNKAFLPGESVSAQAIAQLFSSKKIAQVILLDVHSSSLLDFFPVSATELTAIPLFFEFIQKNLPIDQGEWAVTAPDFGGGHLARELAGLLGFPQLSVKKLRDRVTGEVRLESISGSVNGKNIIIIDDGILTGKTIKNVADALRKNGAKKLYCFATHGFFTEEAHFYLEKSRLDGIFVTNSIFHQFYPSFITVIDCSGVIADYLETQI